MLLIHHTVKETALHDAARKAHVDVARVLIQNGTDVNAVDDKKCTALHEAAWYGHADVVK
jgi:ankyrin repeat protein